MIDTNEAASAPSGEILDDETREMLDELEKEGHEVTRPDKSTPAAPAAKPEERPEVPKPEVTKPTEQKPSETPDGKPGEEGKPSTKREISYVPAYKLKVAESQAQAREKELLGEIEALKSGKPPVTPTVDTPPAPTTTDSTQWAKELAEKHNISEELANDLAAKFNQNQGLPQDVKDKLAELDTIREERLATQAQADFSTEFQGIVDSVKAEYPHATEQELSQVKERLFELAHSEQYHTVPLDEIYRGRSEFRGLIKPPTPSGEPARGGTDNVTETVDYANVTDADIGRMSSEEFAKYSDFMARQEKPNEGSR